MLKLPPEKTGEIRAGLIVFAQKPEVVVEELLFIRSIEHDVVEVAGSLNSFHVDDFGESVKQEQGVAGGVVAGAEEDAVLNEDLVADVRVVCGGASPVGEGDGLVALGAHAEVACGEIR